MAVLVANASLLYRKFCNTDQNRLINGYCSLPVNGTTVFSSGSGVDYRKKEKRIYRIGATEETSWQSVSRSVAGEMEAITGIEHLDQILNQAQEQYQIIVIDWMAAWCRKCIYLKPKLERLAAEYHPDVKFYMVDVNNVSQAMVKRGNISKMPTIQLWKNKELKAEVIGGHKAWVVVDEVREMIEKNL